MSRQSCETARPIADDELARLEPLVTLRGRTFFLPESSVDPRKLASALEKTLRQSGVDFVTGSPVNEVAVLAGRAAGVRTAKSFYAGDAVVNCAGAWASMIKPSGVPTRPVKGQMVCVVPPPGPHRPGPLIQHVIRTPEVYIIPRSDGRIVLGATVEEAGFDKRVDPDTVQRLQHAAASVAPAIGEMRIHEVWAGLRPGSPDDLPILGATSLPGYFAATGHYRDGILAGADHRACDDSTADRPQTGLRPRAVFAAAVWVAWNWFSSVKLNCRRTDSPPASSSSRR